MKQRAEKVIVETDEKQRVYINDDIYLDIYNEGNGHYQVYACEQLNANEHEVLETLTVLPEQYRYNKRTVKQLQKHDVSRAEIENMLDILNTHHNALAYKFLKLRETKLPTPMPEVVFTEEEVEELFKDDTTYYDICPNVDGSISIFAVFEGKVGAFYVMNEPYRKFLPKTHIEYYIIVNSFDDDNTLELDTDTLEAIIEDKCRL